MPRKAGRKVKKGLGSAMIKAKNRRKEARKEYIKEHKAEETGVKSGKQALDSMLEIDTVSDFLYNAELNQRKFDVNIHI